MAFDAEGVIKLLRQQMDGGKLDGSQLSILKVLSSPNPQFLGHLHCETVLASLMRYGKQATGLNGKDRLPGNVESVIGVFLISLGYIFANLMLCTAFGSKDDCNFKTMLPNLLGPTRHHEDTELEH
jgi:hypothetical protein